MRKFKIKVAASLMLGSIFLFSSCIGSFSLHRKLVSWNQTIGDKFVNELVFIALTPVQVVALAADWLVLNSIEFWTGSNPVANVGEVKEVEGEDGDYRVETLENGYTITKKGETASMDLIYNKEEKTWSVVSAGVTTQLLKMNDNGTAQLNLANGQAMTVTLDAQGVATARQATYYAAR